VVGGPQEEGPPLESHLLAQGKQRGRGWGPGPAVRGGVLLQRPWHGQGRWNPTLTLISGGRQGADKESTTLKLVVKMAGSSLPCLPGRGAG
jgi:hypothetical protein